MVQALNQTASSIEIASQAASSHQPAVNNRNFNWKKAGIVTGVGSMIIGGGLGAYFATHKPKTDYCMSSCIYDCKADLRCLQKCSPRDWQKACSTFTLVLQQKLYDAADGCMSPSNFDFIDNLKATSCINDQFSPKKREFAYEYEGMIKDAAVDMVENSFCDSVYRSWDIDDLTFKSDEGKLYFNALEKCDEWSSADFDK